MSLSEELRCLPQEVFRAGIMAAVQIDGETPENFTGLSYLPGFLGNKLKGKYQPPMRRGIAGGAKLAVNGLVECITVFDDQGDTRRAICFKNELERISPLGIEIATTDIIEMIKEPRANRLVDKMNNYPALMKVAGILGPLILDRWIPGEIPNAIEDKTIVILCRGAQMAMNTVIQSAEALP